MYILKQSLMLLHIYVRGIIINHQADKRANKHKYPMTEYSPESKFANKKQTKNNTKSPSSDDALYLQLVDARLDIFE